MSKKNATETRGPGRPKAEIKWPAKKFTFADLCEANGTDFETGKGRVTKLTLRKSLDRDMFHVIESGKNKGKVDKSKPRRNSLVVLLDETREPASKDGLGRKSFVYVLRSRLAALKDAKAVSVSVTKASKPGRKAKVTGISGATAAYEGIKAVLAAPSAPVADAVADTAPVVETAPAAEVAAPVAEATAPVADLTPAPAADTAPAVPVAGDLVTA
jgi:hypothetical protein